MSIDLNSMSKEDLKRLHNEVGKALDSVEARRRTEALAAAKKAAAEYGFSLDDLLEKSSGKSKGTAKYANPSDPAQTWTGRGRKPNWFQSALNAGHTPDEMAI